MCIYVALLCFWTDCELDGQHMSLTINPSTPLPSLNVTLPALIKCLPVKSSQAASDQQHISHNALLETLQCLFTSYALELPLHLQQLFEGFLIPRSLMPIDYLVKTWKGNCFFLGCIEPCHRDIADEDVSSLLVMAEAR